MEFYYYNNNEDDKGRHEVHTENCSHQPYPRNRSYIGYFSNCHDAINKAKQEHPYMKFDGCYYCCYSCHQG